MYSLAIFGWGQTPLEMSFLLDPLQFFPIGSERKGVRAGYATRGEVGHVR
jgi:hypothetical protein